ncbi:sodium:solute symporter family protein [Hydrogenobacter hydrogenophilus]|uniref:Na+/proline symporter n=1 Tax=Hydrogenobacter hydrogenophilus TaxID=35835 RepID=A0A285NZG7_9AQUI|nr:sodium:solute symporter family protein [Hydrogenobacter hydrogenophilus]SNZ13031.1 Na+/proline symporter [Hydrogenobacter hydrogenophilus]
MMLLFVLLYMIITIGIGILASKWVKNTRDFLLAGRGLPLYISASALFAPWFGSETVLGASSKIAKDGLYGVIEDPFGASLCLFLVGLFFAKPLYRMNLLTFGDFYRAMYGRKVEIVASFMLALSYLGWVAAQMVAIGIIMQVALGIPRELGIFIGFGVVLFYTFLGGMWAVSLTDFIQTIMIVVGLLLTLYEVSNGFSQITTVLKNQPPGFYKFFPDNNLKDILYYISAWITIGLGSIPQQDVFQRVMSSRSERVAVLSSFVAGFMYLTVAMIPLILALFAKTYYPELLSTDTQLLLPRMVMEHTSMLTQILFVGALLSAIMSTASGALLAPSAVLSENLIKPLFKELSDSAFLWITRACILAVALISLTFAFMGESIYELVGSSSALSLVSLFVPLVAGLYFKGSNSTSAMASMLCGFIAWLLLYLFDQEYALLVGLLFSILGYLIPSLMRKFLTSPSPV